MPENTSTESRGLFQSLTALLATLLAIAHTRLDLLSTDLEEDRQHLLWLLVFSLTALFCIGLGVVLASIMLVTAFWESNRLLALGSLTGFFVLAGLAALFLAIRKVKTKPKLFATSLAELYKDHQHLDSRS